MRRDDVIARLKTAESTLRGFGVAALYLFGSHARDEAEDDSDVDVFIDVTPDVAFGLVPYMDTLDTIRRVVGQGVEVGYSTRDGLSPYIRADVEREAIRVF